MRFSLNSRLLTFCSYFSGLEAFDNLLRIKLFEQPNENPHKMLVQIPYIVIAFFSINVVLISSTLRHISMH